MSDDRYDDEYDDLDDDQDNANSPAGLRRAKKAAERRAREAEARAKELEAESRELKFLKAGIPADKFTDPIVSDFIKAWDQPLDPQVIRAGAEARGIIAPPKPAGEVEAHDEANKVSAGGTSEGAPGNDTEYLTAMGQAKSQAEILATMRAFGREVDNIV